jgi:predicted RNA-binding Zn-ribbon protein involved in translation (DUF1610 family)
MMKKAESRKNVTCTIDLTKIDGDGAFSCPKCGSVISPDDETDETYQIVDTRVNQQTKELEELVLTCNNCGTTIRLVGFLYQQTT